MPVFQHRMTPLRHITLVLLAWPLLHGCVKEPGIGGRAEIHGRVMEQHHNDAGEPQGDPYPLPDKRVYIVYGDNTGVDDDVRTGPDGRFRFPWLRKGSYRVYTISECQVNYDCLSGTYQVSREAELSGRTEIMDIGDLKIENW